MNEPPSDFGVFLVFSYYGDPGWTLSGSSNSFILAVKTYFRELKKTFPVLLVVNLGRLMNDSSNYGKKE